MSKFSVYKISLKNLSQGTHTFEYELDNKFFQAIDGDEVKKGNVKAIVTVKRTSSTFELNFDLSGVVDVPCSRCLDNLKQEVETNNRLIVKFGAEYSEESDEILVIPENEGEINIAWYLYEYIVLSLPIKHVHLLGECNKAVSTKLRKHRAISADDEEEDDDEFFVEEPTSPESDPRWDALKGLNIEDTDAID